jgi:hypothetical protein
LKYNWYIPDASFSLVNDDFMAKSASLTPKIEKAPEALTQNAALYLQVAATLKEG